MSLEEVRAQARKFQKRIRKRNIREYSAMVLAIVMAIPLAVFLRSLPLIVVAMGLIIAGTLVIAYQFRKRMSTRSFTAYAASMSCLEFYRRELERQRDARAQQALSVEIVVPRVTAAVSQGEARRNREGVEAVERAGVPAAIGQALQRRPRRQNPQLRSGAAERR